MDRDQYPSVLRTTVLATVPARNRSHSSDCSDEKTLIRGITTEVRAGLREPTREVQALTY